MVSVLQARLATKCFANDRIYDSGEHIPTPNPCEDCQCYPGQIFCAYKTEPIPTNDPCQDCQCYEGKKICKTTKCVHPHPSMNCVKIPSSENQCCPDFYCGKLNA